MPVRINRNFLEQTGFDSGIPVGLGMVIHQFREPGEYEVAFERDEQVLERVPLVVAAEPAGEAQASYPPPPRSAPEVEQPPQQVTIEVGQARRAVLAPPLGELEQPYLVRADGYVAFTARDKADSAAIVVRRRDVDGKDKSFDSRRLDSGDIFAVTLVRPGAYSLRNVLAGAEGRIRVAYPQVGKERYHPPPPIQVTCGREGFGISAIDLQPAQGIVFRIETPSRIQIELVEPDDGPQGPRPPGPGGWRKSRIAR